MKRVTAGVSVAALLLICGGRLALAEDVKGKWYFGSNLAVLVTTDNIRSNAALIVAPLGPDGAPFTGDKGEEISCSSTRLDVFCDPRPDDLLSRQTQLEQTLKLDGHFGYGLTSNLSLELDTGYYKGDIKNFDVFTTKVVPFSANSLDNCGDPNGIGPFHGKPCDFTGAKVHNVKQPISAGTVTEIPVTLNAVVRFRKDSNFNPYLGVGVGYLFTSLAKSSSVSDLNSRFASLKLLSVTDELGKDFGRTLSTPDPDGNAIFHNPASVSVDQGFLWQVSSGGEYFYNDRFSVVFDARYVISGQEINISLKGEDQINATAFTEDLFRRDGSLKIFTNSQIAPNPIIDPNVSSNRYTCDANGDGLKDPPPADYDHDGQDDACYGGPGYVKPQETIVVQGGRIRLTNFSFGFGVRFHF